MKNTGLKFMVRMTTSQGIYRTVWEKEGRYFVKDGGKLWDVTDKKEYFRRIEYNVI